MRRFELGVGPLLARMGYVRVDQDPVQSADEVRPVFLVGDYRNSAPNVGSRVVWQTAIVTSAQVVALGAGFRAIAIFDPPALGCFIRQVLCATEDGSFAGWATSNQVGIPGGVVPVGNTQRPFRPDNREPFPDSVTPTVGGFNAATPIFDRFSGLVFPAPFPWWTGAGQGVACRLFCVAETSGIGLSATVEYEVPLEGMLRQTQT